jgi:four helix bundle protein
VPNIVKDKSFAFATRVVGISNTLQTERREYVLFRQLLRSGTAIGALIREAEHAESRADFIHKLAIAQKEANETAYWIELLHATNYLSDETFNAIHSDVRELLKLLTSIIKSSKFTINNSQLTIINYQLSFELRHHLLNHHRTDRADDSELSGAGYRRDFTLLELLDEFVGGGLDFLCVLTQQASDRRSIEAQQFGERHVVRDAHLRERSCVAHLSAQVRIRPLGRAAGRGVI